MLVCYVITYCDTYLIHLI